MGAAGRPGDEAVGRVAVERDLGVADRAGDRLEQPPDRVGGQLEVGDDDGVRARRLRHLERRARRHALDRQLRRCAAHVGGASQGRPPVLGDDLGEVARQRQAGVRRLPHAVAVVDRRRVDEHAVGPVRRPVPRLVQLVEGRGVGGVALEDRQRLPVEVVAPHRVDVPLLGVDRAVGEGVDHRRRDGVAGAQAVDRRRHLVGVAPGAGDDEEGVAAVRPRGAEAARVGGEGDERGGHERDRRQQQQPALPAHRDHEQRQHDVRPDDVPVVPTHEALLEGEPGGRGERHEHPPRPSISTRPADGTDDEDGDDDDDRRADDREGVGARAVGLRRHVPARQLA